LFEERKVLALSLNPLIFASETSAELPAKLVVVMEQRMKLIEQKSAYLQDQTNQVISSDCVPSSMLS
jgi:hypothetical protein